MASVRKYPIFYILHKINQFVTNTNTLIEVADPSIDFKRSISFIISLSDKVIWFGRIFILVVSFRVKYSILASSYASLIPETSYVIQDASTVLLYAKMADEFVTAEPEDMCEKVHLNKREYMGEGVGYVEAQ